MKKKWMVCFLICALLLGCVNASAAGRIGAVEDTGGSSVHITNVRITRESDRLIKVSFSGAEKDQQYTVWAVSEVGIDASTGKPTKESIDNNQNNVIGYMNQVSGDASGNVEFNVIPLLDDAKKGDKYSIFVSTRDGTEDVMEQVALFSVEDLPDILGDANGDGVVDGQDVALCIDNFMKGQALTADQERALDVNGDGVLDGQDVAVITDYFMKGTAMA